jgi:hypothetical protein
VADPVERSAGRAVPAILAIVALAVLVWLGGRATNTAGRLLPGRGTTTVDHGVIVERTKAVARLVTSETVLRDVVVYQNRLLGSTKRSLVVVTGKVLSGFDLDRGTEVKVDHDAKVVRVFLPPAAVLAVEVTELKTYDEQRGLWNPFQPEDRDAIYQNVRRQLHRAAADMGIVQRANVSAARMLETMFSVDGYTAEVRFGAPAPPLDGPRRDTVPSLDGPRRDTVPPS